MQNMKFIKTYGNYLTVTYLKNIMIYSNKLINKNIIKNFNEMFKLQLKPSV